VKSEIAVVLGALLLLATSAAGQQAPVETAAQTAEPNWRFKWDDHPSVLFGDDLRIDFRFRLQTHLRGSEAEMGDSADSDLARRRIGVQGTFKKVLDFEVEREISNGRDPWRDVFVNYRQYETAEVQAGKFKLPFGLDENTSATNLDFVYRSMASERLAPGRDRGVMVHGRVVNKIVRYELGWFAHDGKNARNSDNTQVYGDATMAGRLSVQPFRKHHPLLKDMLLSVAFTGSHVDEGFPGLHAHTALDAPFYTSQVWVNGSRQRTGLEFRWRPGPASLKAEYMRVSTERRGESTEDADLEPLVASGWYVSGTWAVTGEKKADDLTTPRRPLFRGGWGAIEAAARIEGLRFGSLDAEIASSSPRADVVLGNADHAVTLGVNWYPVRHIKLQMNVIREHIANPLLGPAPDSPTFWSRVLRFQIDL
jgi:phosphate-selective porin OprO/OprP